MEEKISITATSDGATASEARWFMKESVSSLTHFRTDGMKLTGNSELLRISWVQAECNKRVLSTRVQSTSAGRCQEEGEPTQAALPKYIR